MMRTGAAAFSVILAAVAVAACQPRSDDGTPATEPASAPASAAVPTPAVTKASVPPAYLGDLDARGREPFWSLEIRKTGLVMTRNGDKLALPNDGPSVANGKVVWAEGKLVASLARGPCSDGMSDKTYPMIAEVIVGGDGKYQGCAGPAGE
jgi:uncharacterized membrane protein